MLLGPVEEGEAPPTPPPSPPPSQAFPTLTASRGSLALRILNFPFRSAAFPLRWFPRSGSEAQRARQPTPGSRVGRGQAGKELVSPLYPWGSPGRGLGEEK